MSKFLSNVIKMGSATLAGQIIGIIVTPFLSRLYSPSDFGMFQLFFSIAGIVGVFSCFSYASTIQLPKKDEDAANIVVLCIFLIFVTSFFAAIFFFIFSGNIEQLLNAPGFSNYIPLLPFALIISGIAGVLISWLSRRDEFGTIAQGNFFSSVTGKGVSLGSGIISASPFGLIIGTITNDATIVVVLLRKAISDFHFFQKVSYKRIKQLALRYKKFPQYQVGADLAGTASVAIVPVALAIFFTPVIIGYYAMAYMVLRLPTKLLGSALYQVFYQKACAEKNITGSIKNIVGIIHARLISAGIFVCLIFMIFGQELFTFALGTQWAIAGVYAQIIAPWMFVAFISIPLLTIFYVLEKQVADLWFSVLQLVTKVIAVIIGGLFADPILCMVLLSLAGVISGIYMNIYTLKIAGVSALDSIQEIIRYFVLSILFCLPLIIAKFLSFSTTIMIGIVIIISVLYYSIIFYKDDQLKQGLIDALKNIFQKSK